MKMTALLLAWARVPTKEHDSTASCLGACANPLPHCCRFMLPPTLVPLASLMYHLHRGPLISHLLPCPELRDLAQVGCSTFHGTAYCDGCVHAEPSRPPRFTPIGAV
jgi:hypothetical protein